MKDQAASLLRHAFTGWIAAAVLLLTAKLSLGPDDAKAVEDALKQIGAGLLLLIVTLAPVIGRLVWAWGANLFRSGAGETKGETNNGRSGGAALLILVSTTAALMGGLPSCTPAQLAAARAIPIKATILTDQGGVSYSSKGGLSVEIDAGK
jgi:hypothetical protein